MIGTHSKHLNFVPYHARSHAHTQTSNLLKYTCTRAHTAEQKRTQPKHVPTQTDFKFKLFVQHVVSEKTTEQNQPTRKKTSNKFGQTIKRIAYANRHAVAILY